MSDDFWSNCFIHRARSVRRLSNGQKEKLIYEMGVDHEKWISKVMADIQIVIRLHSHNLGRSYP